MDNISEQIFQAIDVIADEKLSKLKYDKTIQCVVHSIVNLDGGEYKVRYQGNVFSAFTEDLKKVYKVKDTIYVNVPEGDFSNKKIIVGLVTEQSLSYSQLTNMQNSIKEISPTLDNYYNYDKTLVHGVVAGAPPNSPYSYEYIYEGPAQYSHDQFHGAFQQYSSQYELIRIKASFLTQFHSEMDSGNYGIEVEFYTTGGIAKYKLDLSNFNGDVYHLNVYSPQSVVIQAQKNYLLGLKSIKLFEENFQYDVHRYTLSGQTIENVIRNIPNIFVKDVEIQYVEKIDLTDTTYYLNIATPKGNCFTQSISSIDLLGQLIYQGNNIIDNKSCTCEWFERDLSIMIGNEKYNKEVGFGWKAYKGDNINFNLVTLNRADIFHQQKFKLRTVYNKIVSTAEVEVLNKLSGYNYHIDQITETDNIRLKITNDADNIELVGDWYVSYPDGAYMEILNGQKKNSILIKDYLLYTSATFYCAIYDKNKTKIIGTLDYPIINSESQEDVTIEYIGEDTFRYDANGDVAMTDSEKERTLQVKLTWKDNLGVSYRIEWLDPNGKPIATSKPASTIDDNKIPNSMIKELWVDKTNILHYTIQQKYKLTYNNNVIRVRVVTIDQRVYEFKKEILFLKDGDQGTNGTTYVMAIRPCDNSGLKKSGFNPLVYNNGWVTDLPLRCYVYKDGELIYNDGYNYILTYKWTGVNINFLQSIDSDRMTARGIGNISSSSNSASLEFYVKVQVTIDDRMNGRKTQIYSSYPIDVAVGGISSPQVDISEIPSYIKYSASGVTPSYYNNPIKFIYSGQDRTNNIISLNTNLLEIQNREGNRYLNPATSFIFENKKQNVDSNIAVLKCKYTDYQYIIHPIIMYLDTYGNEAINGWDGTYLDVGEPDEQGHYHYLFAPQIGAGEKDSLNRFTGVVMGKDSGQDLIGLYGYERGECSFGLMQNGYAFFGKKSGGCQITIDGDNGTIQGGQGGESANGMTLTLVNTGNPDRQDAIKIGAGRFTVYYNGKMEATEADISGAIYATSGKIGGDRNKRNEGWTIDINSLHSGTGKTYVELNSNPEGQYTIWAGNTKPENAKFSVTRDGTIRASGDAYIKGEIVADKITAKTEGDIAGWIINKQGLHNGRNIGLFSSSSDYYLIAGNNAILVDTNGNVSFSKDNAKFYVDRKGVIKAQEGILGNWNINNSGIYSVTSDNREEGNVGVFSRGMYYLIAGANSFSASSSGISINESNAKFYVKRNGQMSCTGATINGGSIVINDDNGNNIFTAKSSGVYVKGKIEADSGRIGGWRITADGIRSESGNVYLYADGRFKSGDNFRVSSEGKLTCSGANINGTIRAQQLYLGGSNVNAILNNKFNGREISDKTIGTNQIASSAITTELLQAGSVTANIIAAGAITTDKIQAGAITIGKIADGVVPTDSDIRNLIAREGYQDATGVVSIINGTVTADFISAVGVKAKYIDGGSVSIGGGAGYINTGSAVTAGFALEFSSGGGIRISSGGGGAIYLNAGGAHITIESGGRIGLGTSIDNISVNEGSLVSAIKNKL